ncbi:zf-CHY-domain-containing protein [Byssothecium circinans]|uniref:Zf-CHY-domain-containing protein n=1 Tax=Byssothecium circinans TaxID=147558 RepID=A0A6A5U116_9PLEO|nr:zf-CHY-domain-containing protein [Byssothecium circinans]
MMRQRPDYLENFGMELHRQSFRLSPFVHLTTTPISSSSHISSIWHIAPRNNIDMAKSCDSPSASDPSPNTPTVYGLSVNTFSQCAHWSSPLDIVTIKHACCRKFYACISCHNALETHTGRVWPRNEREEKAVLCGQCKHLLSIDEYMNSGSRCTNMDCKGAFNPGCRNHWAFYFELNEEEGK